MSTTNEQNDLIRQAIAQCQSIARAMQAADPDSWEKRDELRENLGNRFSAGSNVPGYLPDSAPDGFATFNGAKRAVIADMLDDAERRAEDSEAEAEDLTHAAEDVNLESGPFSVTVAGREYWVSDEYPSPERAAADAEELQWLESALNDFDDAEDAEQRIYELPLSVEVRSGWHTPGEESTPEEFRVVLCTGGPHVELLGELDHNGEPCRVWVAARDWGQYVDDVSECRDYAGTLLAFAQRLIAA